ncbi:MAG: hypothetical protein KGJ80_12620 [Chloroflexota bacterium]|nr:hypothetical protein [Chloroflexota bacterium]
MPAQLLFTLIVFNSLVLFLPIAAILLWLKPNLWLPLLTAFLGVVIGLTDLRSDVQYTALLLLVFAFFAGYAKPQYAWVWALLLGIWVPLAEFTALAIGLKLSYRPDILASSIALVPAFIGAYGGVFVQWAAARTNSSSKIDAK